MTGKWSTTTSILTGRSHWRPITGLRQTSVDACAEREANGAELDKADMLRLTCANQYWDPNGPVAQLMTADGELDLRTLDLDNVAAFLGV